ncbi:MAG: hypothetical protein Kow0068_16740 [Marinilabiliales bacterium]
MNRNIILWILSLLITLIAAYYQRKTGPTVPKKIKMTISDNQEEYKFLRTYESDKDCPVILVTKSHINGAKIWYKKYPGNDEWKEIAMQKSGDTLKEYLPKQPPAGKLAYYIELNVDNKKHYICKDEPVIIRYKGAVPSWALIPHIIFMFLAMLFSNYTGLKALIVKKKTKIFILLTLAFLLIGGFIFGPLVQKYAFGVYWSGFPFGWDLTDNKTLISLIFWIFALITNLKKDKPYSIIIAMIMTIIIFSIPHSMFGSQLDYSTGLVTHGN